MQSTLSKRSINLTIAFALLLASMIPILALKKADAATLSRVLVRFDSMKISTGTTGTVCARPTTASTEADVQVAFPAGYTVSTTLGNWTVDTATTTGWPTSATAWLGINTATAAAGQTVTFPSTDLVVGTLYCFNWTNTAAVSIQSGAASSNSGTVTTRASGPSTIDSASYSTASIADDQIAVSASVPQAFSFSLSGNTDSLGTLSTGSVSASPTPRTVTVNTNAKNGWYVWAKDANTGLNSASAAYTIASTTPGSNSTLSSGTEGYNMGASVTQTSGSAVPAVLAGYVGGVGQGGGLDTTLRSVVSSAGTANNAVITLTNHAAIAAATAAATDYADTITVVGAGLF